MEQFNGAILALDLATVSGFAYGRPGQTPKFGSVRFGKAGSERASAYRAFREWLTRWTDANSTDLIVFESAASPMVMAGRTTIETIKKLIGLTEHLEEWAHGKVELREASVQQVRAHFLGTNRNKRAEAKAMTVAKCRSFGWDVSSDDEGDACALWSYQVSCLRPDLAAKMTPLFYGKTGRVINEW